MTRSRQYLPAIRSMCRCGVVVIAVLAVCSSAVAQTAQSDILQSKGIQPERNYFSPEPWEHFDPVTGNVVLTFTDLALPGNAGRALRFQRTFNSQWTNYSEYPTVSRWSFGFPGMVMRVIEKVEPESLPDFETMLQFTPVFLTSDGARRRTIYRDDPNGNPATQPRRWVVAADFSKYDRETKLLYMPDGTICHYDATGSLDWFTDAFNNLVTLTRSGNEVTVTQVLGENESRQVVLTLDDDDLVTRMTLGSRQWQYFYELGPTRDIERVVLPMGLEWAFGYAGGELRTVTTPQGGTVAYTYESRTVYPDPFDLTISEEIRVLRFRDSDSGVVQGHWDIDPQIGYGQIYAGNTVIITPSATKVVYIHEPGGLSPTNVLEGGFGLTAREVRSSGNALLEYDEQRRAHWPVAHPGFDVVTAEVQTHAITRYDGGVSRTYTTQYTYDSPQFANYHHPTQLTETGPPGELARTTSLAYLNLQIPYILGLPATDDIEVGGETFHKEWLYDLATGFRTSETVQGITTTFTNDGHGNVATVSKANGKTTTYTYSWGQIKQTTTSEAGYVIDRAINPDGTVASETRAGRTTTYLYDDLMRVTHQRPPGYPTQANEIQTTYDYPPNAPTVTVTRGTSQVITTLDGFGRPVSTTNSLAIRTATRYDAEGRVTFEGYPVNGPDPDIGTGIEYDDLGRVRRRINPGGSATEYSYGLGTVTIRDPEQHEAVQTWRAFGHPDDARLTGLTDAAGKQWTYTYNVVGQLASVLAEDGVTRTWAYDARKLLSAETHPESGTTTYTYDAAGVLATKTDANGRTFTYAYDGNDRVRSITTPGQTTNITYEPGSDNRLSASNGTTSTSFGYDAAGRLAQRQDSIDGSVFVSGYEYDLNDSVTGVFYPALGPAANRRRVGYEFDTEGRISRVFDMLLSRDYATVFQYHPSGAVTRFTSGNGVSNLFTYDDRQRITSMTFGSHLQLLYQGYDGVGNVGTIVDSRPNMNQVFGYDALDRLTAAVGPYGSIGYAYDVHGNRVDANGSTYTYYPGTLRLETQNGQLHTWDNNGNLLTAPNRTYTYTPRNMMATSSVVGVASAYTYDADDWRVKKTTGADTTYYFRGLNGELLTEWKNPGPAGETRDYVYAGSRLVGVITRAWDESPNDIFGQLTVGGPPTSVTFATPGQRAWLTFEAVAGHLYSVWGQVVSGTGCLFWPMKVLKPDGSTWKTTSSCGDPFIDRDVAPVSGTYTVLVDPNGSSVGTVKVSVYDVVDVSAGAITVDGPGVSVALTTPGQRASFTFDGVQGRRYSVFAQVLSGAGCLFWPITVAKPDGSSWKSLNSCGDPLVEPDVAPATGTYTIVVDPNGPALGSVRVRVFDVVDVSAGAITVDGPGVSVALTKPGQKASFTFDALQGHRYSVFGKALSAGCLFWPITVLKPDGSVWKSTNTCGDALFEADVAQAGGIYTIVADPNGPTTGSFLMRVYDVVDVTGSIATDGTPVTVNLSAPSQKATLTFGASEGHRYSLFAEALSGSTGCMFWPLAIRKPDGSTWKTTNSCGDPFFEPDVASPSGNDTIFIDPNGASTGNVRLQLYDVVDLVGSLTINNAAVPVAITQRGQVARFSVQASAGQQVTVRLTGNSIGSTVVKLLRPDGTQQTSASSSSTNFNLPTQTLSSGGTYTVVIDPNAQRIGNISVRVTSP